MEFDRKFSRNYLSKKKNKTGKRYSILIIVICSLMSLLYWENISLMASRDLVFSKGQYWRLFTTSFVHADLKHLLSNSMMLFILTYFVTAFYGAFYSVILSFGMGVVINYLVMAQYELNTTLVGASGIVYYLWGFWLVLYFFIEKQISIFKRVIRVGAVFLILLVPTSYSPATSYLAHYIGFGVGVVNGLIYYFCKRKKIASFEKWYFEEVPEFEGIPEQQDQSEDQVDKLPEQNIPVQ
jgi:rhomboid protease GluP